MKLRRLLAGLMTAAVLMTGLSVSIPAKAANVTTEEDITVNEDGRKAESFRFHNGKPKDMSGFVSGTMATVDAISGTLIGEVKRVETGAMVRGIDVSTWNGRINWQQVKASGLVDFAILRCGYGDNIRSQDDDTWEYNASECERLGIPYGVYLYSYATNTSMAKSEAEHTLRLLSGHHPSLPVYLDMEDKSTLSVGRVGLANIAQVYCDMVQAAGYDVGVYSCLDYFDNYFCTSTFENPDWSIWVAQVNSLCQYKKPYDIWQYSFEGTVPGIVGNVDMDFWVADNSAYPVADKSLISYQTRLEGSAWEGAVANGVQSNSVCLSKGMQQLKISSARVSLAYSVHVAGSGWTSEYTTGQAAGTYGKNIEAVKIRLTGASANTYDVYYRVKNYGFGWTGWAKNGAAAGCVGYGRRTQAIQIAVIKNQGETVPTSQRKVYRQSEISYRSQIQDYGWRNTAYDGETSGTLGLGKRLESVEIKNVSGISGSVVYQAYVDGKGWMAEVKDGAMAGTEGQGKRLEALQIYLTGTLATKYDVYYRLYSESNGWLGWAKNGDPAGMVGAGKNIEAFQVQLVTKGGAAPGSTSGAFVSPRVSYKTHIQNYGWSGVSYDGGISGTSGKSLRLEGITIEKGPSLKDVSGDIEYRTHIQNVGWETAYKKNGQMSGTSGRSLRLEAIQIRLTGQLKEKYDIYYRVHAQNYGWLDWAKNDEISGTSGLGLRLEAIEIRMVEKGSSAPGSTTRACVSPKVAYTTHVQNVGWQDMKHDGEIAGTTGRSLRLEGIKIVNNTGIPGSINYQVHVQNIGWQSTRYNGQMAGTTGRSLRLEAIRIALSGELAAKYDVYYRVHCQNIGWMGWAKNGDPAGSAGFSYRLEGIQIVYVPKGGAAPGSTARAFIQR